MVVIVTYCMVLVKAFDGCKSPPIITPLVLFDVEQLAAVSPVNISPKSVAFPVDAIVIKSMMLLDGLVPPANTPLVLEQKPVKLPLPAVKSPKSCVFPKVAMVKYYMLFVPVGDIYPPPIKPLVVELTADLLLSALNVVIPPKSTELPVVAMVT